MNSKNYSEKSLFKLSGAIGALFLSLLPHFARTDSLGSSSGLIADRFVNAVVRPDGEILYAHTGPASIFLGSPNRGFIFDMGSNQVQGPFLKNLTGQISTIAITSKGQLYVAGSNKGSDSNISSFLVRANNDGKPDSSFQGPTLPSTPSVLMEAQDGSEDLWVAGENFLTRLSKTGRIVTQISVLESHPRALLSSISPPGSIILGGDEGLTKILSSGTIDQTFQSKQNGIDKLFRVSDGIMILTSRNALLKMTDQGFLDSTFSTGKGFNGLVTGLVPATDGSGSMYVAGKFSQYDGTFVSRPIVRITHDGLLDLGFEPQVSDFQASGLSMNTQGQLLYFGSYCEGNSNDTPYLRYALLDQSGKDLLQTAQFPYYFYGMDSFYDLGQGRILLMTQGQTMYKSLTQDGVAVLNADGSLNEDLSTPAIDIVPVPNHLDEYLFGFGTGWSEITGNQVTKIGIQENHAIALGNGNFVGETGGIIHLYNGSGQALPNFHLNFDGSANQIFMAPVLDNPDLFWAAGLFDQVNQKKTGSIVQIDSRGNVVKKLGIPGSSAISFSDDLKTVWVENIIRDKNGRDHYKLYHYSPSGELVASIDASTVCKSASYPGIDRISNYAPADDGSVYAQLDCQVSSGQYTTSLLVRIQGDGTIDPGFKVQALSNYSSIQGFAPVPGPSGDLVIFGRFTSYGGQPRFGVARIGKDGTLR